MSFVASYYMVEKSLYHIVYFEPFYLSFIYFIIQFCSNEVSFFFLFKWNIFVVVCKMLLLPYLCIQTLKFQASWFWNLKLVINSVSLWTHSNRIKGFKINNMFTIKRVLKDNSNFIFSTIQGQWYLIKSHLLCSTCI
jgi:hypothetical protein